MNNAVKFTILGYICLALQIYTLIINHWSTYIFMIMGMISFIISLTQKNKFAIMEKQE